MSAGTEVTIVQTNQEEFVCITDIAKYKNPEAPADIVKNWLQNKNTIELLGLWEKLNNPNFKLVEFDQFKNEAEAINPMDIQLTMLFLMVKRWL